MLIKQAHLYKIKSGEITLAFRKWKKPLVKKGSMINTSVGQLEITDISAISTDEINPEDALKAGFVQMEDLMEILYKVSAGDIYKIEVRYHSEDPRIGLRAQENLSDQEFEILKTKLQRLDKYSKQGEWTIRILKAIQENPKLRAEDLATKTGTEKMWLKLNIRKLKNLGLTISHETGYSISLLGQVLLQWLSN